MKLWFDRMKLLWRRLFFFPVCSLRDWCGNVTDSDLAGVAKLQDLQDLDLRDCNKVADAGLAHLSKLQNLQPLNLHTR